MRLQLLSLITVCVGICHPCEVRGQETELPEEKIRSAISRAIPLLEKGSAGSADQRQCFTCHSQALPVFALAEAKKRGFPLNEANLERQIKHTEAHLVRGRDGYLKGKGQGGQVVTAGYALWTLDVGGWQPDDTTAAVTHYLLEHQKNKDHWSRKSQRPPTAGSDFMNTYIALRALDTYGTEEQKERIEARNKKVSKWLLDTAPEETEDHVFKLRALPYVGADKTTVEKSTRALVDLQREDGGWGQLAKLDSDAYATGTALVALLQSGMKPNDPVINRGIGYLLENQLEDGTWFVGTRADGFQEYFETGFPHDVDQYISTSASGWSTLALLLTLPSKSD